MGGAIKGAKALSATERTAEALADASKLATKLPGEVREIVGKSAEIAIGSFSITNWSGYPA